MYTKLPILPTKSIYLVSTPQLLTLREWSFLLSNTKSSNSHILCLILYPNKLYLKSNDFSDCSPHLLYPQPTVPSSCPHFICQQSLPTDVWSSVLSQQDFYHAYFFIMLLFPWLRIYNHSSLCPGQNLIRPHPSSFGQMPYSKLFSQLFLQVVSLSLFKLWPPVLHPLPPGHNLYFCYHSVQNSASKQAAIH